MRKIFFMLLTGLLLSGAVFAQGATALYEQGNKFKDNKKYTEALGAYKKAIALNPKYKEALFGAGWCCNELEQYTDALGYLKKANSAWPDQAKIYFEMGYANENLKNYEEAIEQMKKCISLYEDYDLAYKELGNIYFKQKDYKKALDYYNNYAEKASNIKSAIYYYRRGFCENDLGNYDEAINSLSKAVELDAEYNEAFTELGYAYYSKGDYEQAIDQFNKAIAIEKTALPFYYKGLCFLANGNKARASDMYDTLVEMKSDYAAKLKKKMDGD